MVKRLQDNRDTKLDTKQSSPNLKNDNEVDSSIVTADSERVNQPALSREEPNILTPLASRPALGQSLTIYDLNPTFVNRLNRFAIATGMLVTVGNVNQLLETSLGEQLINSIMPIFLTFALLEIAVVFSTFFVLCHLAFSTIGVRFYEDRKHYIRYVRFFGITISRKTTSIPNSSNVYVDCKNFLGLRYHVIRINQDGPMIVRRFSHNDCVQIGQRVADFLQLELEDLSYSNWHGDGKAVSRGKES